MAELRDVLRAMVRDELRAMMDAEGEGMGQTENDEPTTPKASTKGTRGRGRTPGFRVTYHLTKGGRKKGAAGSLKGNFRMVYQSVAKKEGLSKRDHMARTGLALKATESAIYGLQQMGLVESREVE